MELYQLAGYFRHFNLPARDFASFHGAGEKDLKTYITLEKKMSTEDFLRRQQDLLEKMAAVDPDKVLFWGHRLYPDEFLNIDQPPVFLMFEGNGDILKKAKISVVGCRKPEERFLIWMDTELKNFLQIAGATVVSGGAIGIDQKASQVALRAGEPSIIVLPSGLVTAYPRGIKQAFPSDQVLYLSEYFPTDLMHKGHFIRRNRLISALGQILLAVQFEIKSGTMITVNYGLSQNKEIATIPDHPLCSLSSGNLKIIKEGAHIVSSRQDLLDLWHSRSPMTMRQLPLAIVPTAT